MAVASVGPYANHLCNKVTRLGTPSLRCQIVTFIEPDMWPPVDL